nr:hypothetical protein [Tanacetum cinerariifolium]
MFPIMCLEHPLSMTPLSFKACCGLPFTQIWMVSPTKPEQALSPTPRPSAPIIKDWISDFEEDSQTQALQVVSSFAQSSEHVKSPRHLDQPLKTTILAVTFVPVSSKTQCSSTRRNKKACFICKSVDHLIKDCDFHTRQLAQRNYAPKVTHKQYASLSNYQSHTHMVRPAVLPQSKSVLNTAARPVSTALRNLPTSNSPPRVTAVKALVVSAAQSKKGTWAHDALLESSSSKPHDESSSQVPKSSGNHNPTISSSNHPADQMKTLTVESLIPTVNILGVTTSSDETIGVEADVSNLETSILASPTATLRIHKDHPKSQIIGPVDTPI